MDYSEFKDGIRAHLNDAAEDFFMVGYFLRQISENALFQEDGYKSIWEFAKGEYNLSTSSASRFMAINARFSIDGGEHMAEKYIGMGVSKLQEMLGLPDEELEKVTQETTVREIRAMKKKLEPEPLSYYGLPKTECPEGSLIYTPGCGNGKYDCFTCVRDCKLRQEDRYCRTAPMGDPFPCSQMAEEARRDMEHSLYRSTCQFLHPELAHIRTNTLEPNPCCLECKNKFCYSRCDVAKKRDEKARKDELERIREEHRKEEESKPEPSDMEIKAFYDYAGFKITDNITADGLKKEYSQRGGAGMRSIKEYRGSSRGLRINEKRELTWAQIAKRFKEIQEKEAAEQRAAEPEDPDIIDAEFKEVESVPEEPVEEKQEVVSEPEEHAETDEEEEPEPEEEEPDPEESEEPEEEECPEVYTLSDVTEVLRKHRANLEAYREVGGMPEITLKKQRILVDALEFLEATLKQLEEQEQEAEDNDD